MSFFQADSYKAIMADALTGAENRGLLTRAAEALGCQRSYLSRVLLGELHLTPDHAFALCEFLNYGEEKRIFFQLLVERERAGSRTYRLHLDKRVSELRQAHQNLANQTGRKNLTQSDLQVRYFSSWIWTAVHFLTSIPKFQAPDVLAHHLGLPLTLVKNCLSSLKNDDFVKQDKQKWIYSGGEFHLDKGAANLLLHHQNWRARAMLDAQNDQTEGVHYTAVQTLSRADAAKIKEKLLSFIAETSRIAGPSNPEEAVVLTIDLFNT